jgi:hypothetical protein
VRFTAADDIPLSTAAGRDSAYLAVHMFNGQPYEKYFRAVEEVMKDLDGRPHWGKLHYQDAETLSGRYRTLVSLSFWRFGTASIRTAASPTVTSIGS